MIHTTTSYTHHHHYWSYRLLCAYKKQTHKDIALAILYIVYNNAYTYYISLASCGAHIRDYKILSNKMEVSIQSNHISQKFLVGDTVVNDDETTS